MKPLQLNCRRTYYDVKLTILYTLCPNNAFSVKVLTEFWRKCASTPYHCASSFSVFGSSVMSELQNSANLFRHCMPSFMFS